MRTKGARLIAHAWAHGLPRPKTSNSNVIYDGGDTIYSYGSHFPMAKRLAGKVFLTTQSYSSTTEGHLSAVRQAISHMDVIECCYIPKGGVADTWAHENNIKEWIASVKQIAINMDKARLKQPWLDKLAAIRGHAQNYFDTLKVNIKASDRKLIFESDLSKFIEAAKRETAAALAKKKALAIKAGLLHNKWLAIWRSADTHKLNVLINSSDGNIIRDYQRSLDGGNMTWLTADNEQVYTSKGIKMPHDVAKRYYTKYLAVVRMGGCDNNCNYKMLDYSVELMNADTLNVGCHHIPRTEIDYIANKLNW